MNWEPLQGSKETHDAEINQQMNRVCLGDGFEQWPEQYFCWSPFGLRYCGGFVVPFSSGKSTSTAMRRLAS